MRYVYFFLLIFGLSVGISAQSIDYTPDSSPRHYFNFNYLILPEDEIISDGDISGGIGWQGNYSIAGAGRIRVLTGLGLFRLKFRDIGGDREGQLLGRPQLMLNTYPVSTKNFNIQLAAGYTYHVKFNHNNPRENFGMYTTQVVVQVRSVTAFASYLFNQDNAEGSDFFRQPARIFSVGLGTEL